MYKILTHIILCLPILSFAQASPEIEDASIPKLEATSSTSLLESVLKALQKPFFSSAHKVLDVGCKDGQITAYLASALPESEIVGCDMSKELIKEALKQNSLNKFSNLKFIKKNTCNLNFKEEFDRTVSLYGLDEVQDKQAAVKEMFDSLKPGGKALIISFLKSSEDSIQMICSKLITSEKWAFYFQNFQYDLSLYTEHEYQELIKKTGFSIEEIQTQISQVTFENWQVFENWISRVLLPLQHLHEKKQRSFLNDLYSELKDQESIDAQGKIHLHLSQIELIATKPID